MVSLNSKSYALEPGAARLYPNFVGVDDVATVELTVDAGTEEFVVGDTVSGAAGSGVVYEIQDLAGTWDAETGDGTATLILTDVTGTFSNDEAITGAIAGAAVADGTGSAGDDIINDPSSVMGKGVSSVVAGGLAGTAGEYVVTLQKKWAGLLNVKGCVLTSGTADDWNVVVAAETVASTKTITIQVFKGGAATSLTTTDKLYLELVLATSSMKPLGY